MALEPYLRVQARLHPSLFPVDVAKVCYQAAYGAEHLLGDIPKAHVSFLREFEACRPMDVPLVEAISDEVARVSLPSWKFHGILPERLFSLFTQSAFVPQSDPERNIIVYLDEARKLAGDGVFPFPAQMWYRFDERYRALGHPSVHHSEAYRFHEHPSYRLVLRKYLDMHMYFT
ncbi:MAG: hypothetical protein WCR76_09860 [Sphaerochaetaceae bacterium]